MTIKKTTIPLSVKAPTISEEKEIRFSQLHNKFDVRTKPNTEESIIRRQNRILDFAEKMAAGVRFPPIVVTRVDRFPGGIFNELPPEDYIIVDGRTRHEAIEIERPIDSDPLVKCVVLHFKMVLDVEAYAFHANYATAEPMTLDETRQIVTKLWNAGHKEKTIHEKTGIPKGQIEKIVSGIRECRLLNTQTMRDKLHQAAEAVKSGASAEEAAKRFDVSASKIRELIQAEGSVSVAGLKAGLTRSGRSYRGALNTACRKAFDAYSLEKITASELRDVMQHSEQILADIQRTTTEVQRSAETVLGSEKGTVFIS